MSSPGGVTVLNPGAAYSPLRWEIPALSTPVALQALHAAAVHDQGSAVKVFLGGRPASLRELCLEEGAHRHSVQLDVERFRALPVPVFCYGRNVQVWHRPLFEMLVETLMPYLARTGLASGPIEAEVFAGDYPLTPGGVHREACSNLHLVLAGTKAMHLWSGERWIPAGTTRRNDVAAGSGTQEEYLPALDPGSVLDRGCSLTGTVGQGFAWTAGTWHVAETQGLAVALNIAAYQRAPEAETPLQAWADRLDGAVPSPFLDQYRRHTGIERLSLAAALGRLSALGMRPAAVQGTRRPVRRVRLRLVAPVVWARTDDDDLMVAALGAVLRMPPETPVHWLAERWNSAEVAVPAAGAALAGWLCQQGVLEELEDQ